MSSTEMVSFPRELSDDLAELIATRARVCGGGAFEIWEAICEGFGAPASQRHDPIAWMVGTAFWWTKEEAERDAAATGLPIVPVGPQATIPDGYCLMPTRLTAENGAKALLLGEFKLEVTQECPECRELDDPVEGCEICDGEGEYGQRHTVRGT
ncbi:hypothetical protein [Pseudomonas urethralis]|uniref:hypothetical protein n=1 Tax=Pseudomonas urethralis TaxID=2740517 RepID=UPI001596AFA0|nr:hypothetical protein [Pseudomonas urethralis]